MYDVWQVMWSFLFWNCLRGINLHWGFICHYYVPADFLSCQGVNLPTQILAVPCCWKQPSFHLESVQFLLLRGSNDFCLKAAFLTVIAINAAIISSRQKVLESLIRTFLWKLFPHKHTGFCQSISWLCISKLRVTQGMKLHLLIFPIDNYFISSAM